MVPTGDSYHTLAAAKGHLYFGRNRGYLQRVVRGMDGPEGLTSMWWRQTLAWGEPGCVLLFITREFTSL